MSPANLSWLDKGMEGVFLVKDSTWTKGKKGKKCRVCLQTSTNGEVILQISSIRLNEEVANRVFAPPNWFVCFAESDAQLASLALISVSGLHETLVLEATHENIDVLRMMERRLREILKVVSYDVVVVSYDVVEEMVPDKKTSCEVIHIFHDKVLVTQGFPPDLRKIFSHSLHHGDNDRIKCVDSHGLCLSGANPEVFLLSEHRDDIWKTLQGCLTSGMSESPNSSCERSTMVDQTITTLEHPYHNLPPRPCRYIYMNLVDKMQVPFENKRYVNIFNVSGAIYQNWQSCEEGSKNKNCVYEDVPPPCPPRRPPPRLPPKPKSMPRNRPPDSPLPPVPCGPHNVQTLPPLPPRSMLWEPIGNKELQCVVYSSKPVVGQFWVIQVIFLQKNDHRTLQRIKKLEEESNYQLLKPLPEYVKITGDSKVSLLDIESGCTLKSNVEQIVEFNVVNEAVLQSCWMVIEFHLEHNEQMKRNFHAKIVVQPKNATRSVQMTKKEILISANFQDEIQNSLHPTTSVCNALKDMDVRKYLELCSLMDVPCTLRNDWTGLAGEIGLNIEQVFKIQSKAYFPNFSPTNEVLNIWSHRQDSACGIDGLRNILEKLQRYDVLSVLNT